MFDKIGEFFQKIFGKDSQVYDNKPHITTGKDICMWILENDLTDKKLDNYNDPHLTFLIDQQHVYSKTKYNMIDLNVKTGRVKSYSTVV